jgi:restriction system protein
MGVEAYHFRPDVFGALREAIPLICKSKRDVLTFFRGAGLRNSGLTYWEAALSRDPETVGKYPVTENLLKAANEDQSDDGLRVRREIIRRVVDFNDFERCWPDKQQAAKGAVQTVRELVHEKDAFTRMAQAHDGERRARMAEAERQAQALRDRAASRDSAKRALFGLFSETDQRRRGLALEGVLNRLFALDGLAVREALTPSGGRG